MKKSKKFYAALAAHNYEISFFTANGIKFKQWTDHCGNVMHTERV